MVIIANALIVAAILVVFLLVMYLLAKSIVTSLLRSLRYLASKKFPDECKYGVSTPVVVYRDWCPASAVPEKLSCRLARPTSFDGLGRYTRLIPIGVDVWYTVQPNRRVILLDAKLNQTNDQRLGAKGITGNCATVNGRLVEAEDGMFQPGEILRYCQKAVDEPSPDGRRCNKATRCLFARWADIYGPTWTRDT